MNLVIVESPAKAKTINKYLGSDYIVLASYGHIRDLPSKNGSVDPENNFKMEWEVDSFSKKYLKEITDAAKNSSGLNSSISCSLSVISFKATDCTLPADLDPGSFVHKIGEILKPTK